MKCQFVNIEIIVKYRYKFEKDSELNEELLYDITSQFKLQRGLI